MFERLARNLRKLRQAEGLSQEAFADDAGLHRTYISDLERGARNPSITIVDKIARALGVPLSALLVFAGTATWSLRNIEFGSSLGQRLIGPALLLLMIAPVMPLLFRWRRRQTVSVFALLIGLTAGLGISSLPNGPLVHQTAAVTRFLDAETKKEFLQ